MLSRRVSSTVVHLGLHKLGSASLRAVHGNFMGDLPVLGLDIKSGKYAICIQCLAITEMMLHFWAAWDPTAC